MLARNYRITVVGCALSCFMLGLHLPGLHQVTHHGAALSWPALAAVSVLSVTAVASLWILLRAPRPVSD